MFRNLYRLVPVLLAGFILASCQKEFVIDGLVPPVVSGPATYTWEGAPGVCATAIVGGTYSQGSQLDSSHRVTIVVNVSVAGTYSATTSSVNGITFSGSGTFAGTGPQSIILYGSGTPTAAGPSVFTAGTNGCTFSITVGAPIPPSTFTWEGAPGVCTSATVDGNYIVGTALDNSNKITISVNVSSAGSWSATTATENGIRFSGSGTFTTTGPQTVVLQGSGTPVAAISAIFTPGTGACSFTVNSTTSNPGTDFLRAKINGVMKEFNQTAWGEWNSDTLSIGGMVAGSVFEVFAIDIIGTTSLINGVYKEEGAVPAATAYVEAGYTTDALDIWYVDINAPTPRTDPFTVTITNISPTRVEGTFFGGLWNAAGGTTQLQVADGAFSLPIQ